VTVVFHLASFPESARTAKGAVVAIDAFRAFTTAAYALASGAAEIVMVKELDEALALKTSNRVDLTIGERHGLKQEGFDFGNSPTAMRESDLKGARIAQTTTNGTATLAAAPEGAPLYAAALVNARATGEAIRDQGEVTIIAAGVRGTARADEDELCALYLRSIARNAAHDERALQNLLMNWFGTDEYLSTREQFGPRTDWLLALELNKFDFAIKVTREAGLLVAKAG
jgi:2-phosphosulfolactate phosphatase